MGNCIVTDLYINKSDPGTYKQICKNQSYRNKSFKNEHYNNSSSEQWVE